MLLEKMVNTRKSNKNKKDKHNEHLEDTDISDNVGASTDEFRISHSSQEDDFILPNRKVAHS